MNVIKNISAILMTGMALLFLKTVWKHIRTHDVSDLGTRLVIDLVFAAVFGYCAYALSRSAHTHSRKLAAKQEQEPPAPSVWPPPPPPSAL